VKFRDDIDPENTWVVSDTHFGHENIVGYCSRPDDHDQLMLEQWRAHVPDDATVLHLGDLCWKSNGLFKHTIAPRLSGARKLLILGNHDKGRPSFYRDCGFQIVRPFAILYGEGVPPYGGQATVEFAHYPVSAESPPPDWSWRLHGHIHNNGYYDGRSESPPRWDLVPFLRNHINLSVEQTRYRPVNLKLLLDAAILGRLPND
jgi:calcineurin-like phosphoesterase family protein